MTTFSALDIHRVRFALTLYPMGAPSPQPSTRIKRSIPVRKFAGVSAALGGVVALAAMPMVGASAYVAKQANTSFEALPSELKSLPLPQRTYVEAADGTRIATLYDQNRIVVPLNKISTTLQKALIATEDARFYEHHGVDPQGSARALLTNASSGDVQQGSSTITMQYVRNLLITNATTKKEIEEARERTMSRKIQEMRYALAMEKKLSKQQILDGYLNVAYFGSGAYGAEAASRRYFNKHANELTLPQAALLAGMVQNPVGYDPFAHPKTAEHRRNVVLERMQAQGVITPTQMSQAQNTPLKKTLDPKVADNGCTTSFAPFYCDYVLREVANNKVFGDTPQDRAALLKRGGIVIKTNLDVHAQKAATTAAMNRIPPKDGSKKAAAVAMVKPGTGGVMALAQNRKWGTKGQGNTTYNYAVNAADGGTIGMQAGSTFKIFTIAAALEDGISPNHTIYSPSKKYFPSGSWGCKGHYYDSYSPANSTGSGTFNMKQAAAKSVNTYFVALEREAGLCNTVKMAKRMGVTRANGDAIEPYPSFTLGAEEVSPLTMANAYATVDAHGVYCKPHAIDNITDLSGRKLYEVPDDCKSVMSRKVADATTAVLTNVMRSGGTGSSLSLGRDAAGKTGTTDNNSAVWFVGYTPQVATAVWVGDPRGGFKHPVRNIVINGQYYDKGHGSTLPGPIWEQTMRAYLDNKPAKRFDLDAKFGLSSARYGGGDSGSSSSSSNR